MNSVNLIGNLVSNPEMYGEEENLKICKFVVAVNGRGRKDKSEKDVDFPRITVFGKQAENCKKYLSKGKKVAIEGKINTNSYINQQGNKVYTTEVIARRVDFLTPKGNDNGEAPVGFEVSDEEIPF